MIPLRRCHGSTLRFAAANGGYSASELLVVLSVMALIGSTALPEYRASRMQIQVAQRMVIANLRLARASAISKSTHFQVSFVDAELLQVARMQQVPAGSGNWQVDTSNTEVIRLPRRTHLAAPAVGKAVEFNSRGSAVNLGTPLQIEAEDDFGVTRSLEVWPSGQVNEL